MIDWRKELRDQSAHMLAAQIALFPAIFAPHVITFAWAGFCMGAVREFTEHKAPFTFGLLWHAVRRSKLDLTFWTLGIAGAAFAAGLY